MDKGLWKKTQLVKDFVLIKNGILAFTDAPWDPCGPTSGSIIDLQQREQI